MNHRAGRLFVIEGIDGAGKSTQAAGLADFVDAQGWRAIRSREPTHGPHGQKLRASMAEGRLDIHEELDLFIKDRRDHVDTLINPALQRGDVVILDRYYFSTIAYQGARGLDPDDLQARNESFAPSPDLLIILDLDPTRGLARIREGRKEAPDTFEVPELLARSRQIFLDLASALPYAHTVDAGQSTAAVSQIIRALAAPFLVRAQD